MSIRLKSDDSMRAIFAPTISVQGFLKWLIGVFAVHSPLIYLPFSLALSLSSSSTPIFRVLISSGYVLVVGLLAVMINDFFDTTEDQNRNLLRSRSSQLTVGIIGFLFLVAIGLTLLAALSFDLSIMTYTLVALVVSWWYSDNRYLPKLLRKRLKAHYVPEVLALVIGSGAIFAVSLSINGVSVGIWLPYFVLLAIKAISMSLTKDVSQIEKDRRARNITFPVKYGKSKTFLLLEGLSYTKLLSLGLFISLGLVPPGTVVAMF